MKVSSEKLFRLSFFLYFIGLIAFKRGYGFDAIFCRATFFLMIGCEMISIQLKDDWKNYSINKTVQMMIAFIAFYFVSIFWSKSLDDGLYYVNIFSQIFLGVIIVSRHIQTRDDLEDYLKIALAGLTYMAVVLVARTPVSAWGSERVGSVMALNANTIGMCCATALLLCLYFAQQKKLCYPLGVCFAVIALLSGSRKSFGMIIISLAIFWGIKDKGFKKIRNIVLIVLCIVFLFNLIMTNEKFYNVIGYRLEKTMDALSGESVRDGSAEERAYYRKHAMELFAEQPFVGVGANGFVTRLRQEGYWHLAYSHCNYTELLSTLGMVGFCLYYAIQLRILRHCMRIFKKKRDRLSLMIITFIITNLMTEYYCVSYISVFTQIMIAICGTYVDKIALCDFEETTERIGVNEQDTKIFG